jgi:prefoldin subunit 5
MKKKIEIIKFQLVTLLEGAGFSILVAMATMSPHAYAGPETDAETRAAIAEAERAELLARLPPSTIKPLQGSIDTRQFGAAGLVKAFDLARELATELCTALPAGRKTTVYEPAATQGVLVARQVADAIERLKDDLNKQNRELQQIIEAHTPQGSGAAAIAFTLLTAVPATLKAGAELSSLFKTDVSAQGIAYGDGARSLFTTALARGCPDKLAGLGSGYLGELDGKQYAALLARVRALAAQRGEYAQRIAVLDKLADAAKGEEKRALASVAAGAGALLKTVDAFIDSLKAGEAGDRSPLFNAARYLGYAARTEGMLVLDFDLRLEGMTIVKDGLFTGQKLRLAGVAFLWYRVHEPDGTLLAADAVRRVTRPVEVDLRGDPVGGEFWDGAARRHSRESGNPYIGAEVRP